MYLLVGLGNPGPKYKLTRHNAGFLVIDQIAQNQRINLDRNEFKCIYGKGRIGDQELLLAKPQTFMNLSGQAVVALVNYFKLDPAQTLIISDDLDLPFGTIRLKPAGSSGGHKGLASIINLLGTNRIPRLRIGIGKPGEQDGHVIDYVLTPFKEDEQALLQSVVMAGAEAAISFVTKGPEYTMNHFNGMIIKSALPGQPENRP